MRELNSDNRWMYAAGFVAVAAVLLAAAAAASPSSDEVTEFEDTENIVEAVDAELVEHLRPHHHEEPRDTEPAVTVDGVEKQSLQQAVDAAEAGDTVEVSGVWRERVVVDTSDVVVRGDGNGAVVDGVGEGRVVEIEADDVVVENLWIRNSGFDPGAEDSGVYVDGDRVEVRNSTLTDVTFGVWIDGASDVVVENNTISGREDVTKPNRGNGVHLWETEGTQIHRNHVSTVRDGVYYSWSTDVHASENVMRDLRYGVHYMYTDDSRLERNVAFDNEVGFALMVSQDLRIADNLAVSNHGGSGHGMLVKGIDDTTVEGNAFVGNVNGIYVYNSHRNDFHDNLFMGNDVGVHYTAASSDESVEGNSFVYNLQQVYTTTTEDKSWSGNYWSDGRAADLTGDGDSDVMHRPSGAVEQMLRETPEAYVYADSPAFDAVRLAESTFPQWDTPGVTDRSPMETSPHDWRSVAEATDRRLNPAAIEDVEQDHGVEHHVDHDADEGHEHGDYGDEHEEGHEHTDGYDHEDSQNHEHGGHEHGQDDEHDQDDVHDDGHEDEGQDHGHGDEHGTGHGDEMTGDSG